MEKFRLVRPEKGHEKQAMAYLEEFYAYKSELHGAGGLDWYEHDYDGWLEKLATDRTYITDEKRVPSETFFLMKQLTGMHLAFAEESEILVGMVEIHFELNRSLLAYGGHIGYSIRPTERQKGYGKLNLFLALNVCSQHRLDTVMLDCDKTNIASAKTMLALGARQIYEGEHPRAPKSNARLQRYIITVDPAIDSYRDTYAPMISEYVR